MSREANRKSKKLFHFVKIGKSLSGIPVHPSIEASTPIYGNIRKHHNFHKILLELFHDDTNIVQTNSLGAKIKPGGWAGCLGQVLFEFHNSYGMIL